MLWDHQDVLQEDISEWQTAMLLNEITFSFKANLHCILLAPQVHTGGRNDCVPLAFPDYGGIKKQVNKMKRTEDGNVGNKTPSWIGEGMYHEKQEEGRNKEGEKAGEVIESSVWEAYWPGFPAHEKEAAAHWWGGREGGTEGITVLPGV